MFSITPNGYHMIFANGFGVSVQWGAGNYCENQSIRFTREQPKRSPDAEVTVIRRTFDYHDWELVDSSQVWGWQSADNVAKLIAYVSALPSNASADTIIDYVDDLLPS